MLRDVLKLNAEAGNFRIFGPDETNSNRLNAVFEVTDRTSTAEVIPTDDHVAATGRVMERVLTSTNARGAGWKAICSPAGTGFSPAMRRSFT